MEILVEVQVMKRCLDDYFSFVSFRFFFMSCLPT